MNLEETAQLFRMARAAFPAQKFDDLTPDLWAELFADYPFADMREGLLWCTRNSEWLNVKDMLGEVRRIRQKRIAEAFEGLYPPAEVRDSDDPAVYIRWLAEATKALADGEVPLKPQNLVRRNVRQLMAGLGETSDADVVEDPEAVA